MTVTLELHNTGDPSIGAEVRALVEHALSDRPGDWQVSIVGSRETDGWGNEDPGTEMGLSGPTPWREVRESTSLWRSLMCS
jgi:hypothetical protein